MHGTREQADICRACVPSPHEIGRGAVRAEPERRAEQLRDRYRGDGRDEPSVRRLGRRDVAQWHWTRSGLLERRGIGRRRPANAHLTGLIDDLDLNGADWLVCADCLDLDTARDRVAHVHGLRKLHLHGKEHSPGAWKILCHQRVENAGRYTALHDEAAKQWMPWRALRRSGVDCGPL